MVTNMEATMTNIKFNVTPGGHQELVKDIAKFLLEKLRKTKTEGQQCQQRKQ